MADAEAKAAAMAAKRKELEAKIAAARAEQEKAEAQKANFFGTHDNITCDGCGTSPIVGYRYRCTQCANHDVCEECYDRWRVRGEVANGLGKQVISQDPKDHAFKLHKEKGFKAMASGAKAGPTEKSAPKVKPNDPCNCGSKKKYKKCCGAGGG